MILFSSELVLQIQSFVDQVSGQAGAADEPYEVRDGPDGEVFTDDIGHYGQVV